VRLKIYTALISISASLLLCTCTTASESDNLTSIMSKCQINDKSQCDYWDGKAVKIQGLFYLYKNDDFDDGSIEWTGPYLFPISETAPRHVNDELWSHAKNYADFKYGSDTWFESFDWEFEPDLSKFADMHGQDVIVTAILETDCVKIDAPSRMLDDQFFTTRGGVEHPSLIYVPKGMGHCVLGNRIFLEDFSIEVVKK